MSTPQILILVLVIIVVVALVVGGWYLLRRRSLRERFGPEYDRVVADSASRTVAERELRDRERRHAQLELVELSPQARAEYTRQWEELQIRFVDAPEEAVNDADDLVTRLISDRGYPTGDYDEQVAQLSVEHAATLASYREAHDISLLNRRGEADTEKLRMAVVHYRALVAELLSESGNTAPGYSGQHEADGPDHSTTVETTPERRHHAN
jgi:hypothetical protein